MTPASRKHQEILEFIRRYRAEHRVSPTYDEIGAAVGLKSRGNVALHLERMEARGLIRRHHQQPRSIEIVDDIPALAERVLDSIVSENLRKGTVTVKAEAVADLDIALAERRPRLQAPLEEHVRIR